MARLQVRLFSQKSHLSYHFPGVQGPRLCPPDPPFSSTCSVVQQEYEWDLPSVCVMLHHPQPSEPGPLDGVAPSIERLHRAAAAPGNLPGKSTPLP
jgi:hypothetical protein